MQSQLTVNFSTLCAGCLCWEGLVRWMGRVFWGSLWCFLPCVLWVAYLIPAIVLLPPRVWEHMADAWKKEWSLGFLHASIHSSLSANFSITVFTQPYVVFSSLFKIANVVLLPISVRHATAVDHSSFDGLLFPSGWFKKVSCSPPYNRFQNQQSFHSSTYRCELFHLFQFSNKKINFIFILEKTGLFFSFF